LNIPAKTEKVSFRLTDYQPWARAGPRKMVEGVCTSGARVAFGPQDGNYILWLRDGAKAMYEMCKTISSATRFIWIIDFELSPGINLARNCAEGQYYDLLKQNADPKLIESIQQLNSTHKVDKETIPLVSLLEAKAQEEHDGHQVKVRVIVFHPDPAQRWDFIGGSDLGAAQARDQIHNWNQGMKGWINLQDAKWGGPWTSGYEVGGHHQKSTIVGVGDKLVGFCGGVDLTYARWAASSHSFSDPLDLLSNVPDPFKIAPQMGFLDPEGVLGEWNDASGKYRTGKDTNSHVFWHDVHAKFVGPAAAQLASNFIDRYDQSEDTPSDWKKFEDFAWIISSLSSLMGSAGDQNMLDSSESYSSQKVSAQIIRSFERYGGKSDWGIWDAYRNLFSHAEKSVFIESQYSFEDEKLTNLLIKRVRENSDLKVIIVAPFVQDSPSLEGDIMKHTRYLIDAGGDDPSKSRVKAYSLATFVERDGENVRIPIYVHAKIAVVDDEWSVVGSANLDRMGMGGATSSRGSSEIAVLVKGHDQAVALRSLLAAEHLGTSSPPDDFDALFDSFYHTANRNGEPRGGNPMNPPNSQLVFHRAMSSGS
jgi:phosphatidylserine/phosphatidylglycerophosphate/cardiolipin synthase-like enzyme